VRSLNPDEVALWARVAATITPLSREKNAQEPVEKPQEPAAQPKPATSAAKIVPPRRESSVAIAEKTLDGSWDKKLRSGAVEPDRVIDLHGLNLDRAWTAIDRGLDQAIRRGERVVLLITGHHRTGEPPLQRGKIRAAVHDWLAASRHASHIAAVRGAHGRHGGGGSLYLILRRDPPSR